jgi:hypothetical protein
MTGHNPTIDRSKLGTKRHILTDKKGIPLSAIVITSANTPMMSLLQLKQLTAWLSKDHHHPNQKIKRNRTCALIKHIIPKK